MKYRRLSKEELEPLEKDFIDFLVVNGITADEWEKMQKETPDKCEQVVDQFSDVVFESIMRKVRYLELRTPTSVKAFQCLPDQIVLVGMDAPEDSGVNFMDETYIASAIRNPPGNLRVYTTTKPYAKDREVELFEMTQKGCTIADGRLFKALCLSLPAK
ncbi:DUF6495 family protein [Roseivirga sp. BDSF3-8]|uniref:DUF6495 family protein n=1 Tax=Roseivirga sp. BDSF3-8 TaxID=3241598 RepID=UPI003531A2BA